MFWPKASHKDLADSQLSPITKHVKMLSNQLQPQDLTRTSWEALSSNQLAYRCQIPESWEMIIINDGNFYTVKFGINCYAAEGNREDKWSDYIRVGKVS